MADNLWQLLSRIHFEFFFKHPSGGASGSIVGHVEIKFVTRSLEHIDEEAFGGIVDAHYVAARVGQML